MRQTGQVVKDGRALDPIDGTTSSHLLRLVRDSALRLGADPARVAAVPGTADSVLAGELNRIPLDSLLRLWSLIAETGPGAGLAVAAAAPLGTLTTWDYLVTSGPTLADSLHAARPYHRLVTAAAEGFDLTHDRDLTVGYRTTATDPAVSAVVNEYVLAYYLRRAREATGRHIIPTRITFGHPAPPEHSALTDAFGTAAIEFDAPADSITFRAEDAETPLPRADAMLGELLRSHADLVLASARAIPGPLEAFRTALTAAVAAGEPTLAAVARRLAMSTRTLQRHLADHDTTWRAEYDRARYEQARALLAENRLSMAAIAHRLGFTDDRALRKAMRRWTGGTASQLRSEMAG